MKISALMDYTKIQCDIIKEYEKYPYKYIQGIHNRESVWQGVCIDGHVVVFIPDCMYLLDNNKVFRDKVPCDFSKMISETDLKPLTLTNELIQVDKNTLNVLKDENENEHFVNSKYIDIFAKSGIELNYKGINSKSPIYVYSRNDLIGLICPINYSRG